MQSAERIGWSENITKNATHALEERIKRMYWETPTRWYREHPRYPNTRRNKLYIAMKRAIEERRYNLMDPITDVTVRDLMQGD